uniref:Uncharacterized protein n=1 Tax=Chromera velia CCMP2878 TaxID=1169474 RepID=A0A0G4G006_9ALVE|eukprot:Cvel_3967.t1-p1 / transcript=Cvel_3967.t1 / gene=Cvel_3967 / organism=Chromera_velia_CCMP2878 / gene_product=hypothetical protein / transcript_product=hypothetical protein / location=Cvel_scaffold168:71021-71668(+) / protein_length=216 / sequence_SO=supercontig / SO=protein_coding / is_pseudo=false
MKDYYTHPAENSLEYTKNMTKFGKTTLAETFTKPTPYKFVQNPHPRYLQDHPKPSQFPHYKPLVGPMGAQYTSHPPDMQHDEGDNMGTTYRHFYTKKTQVGEFLDKTQPAKPAPFPGPGAGYGTNYMSLSGVSWLPKKRSQIWKTTYRHYYVPQPMSKAVCCKTDEDKCGFCDSYDAAVPTAGKLPTVVGGATRYPAMTSRLELHTQKRGLSTTRC